MMRGHRNRCAAAAVASLLLGVVPRLAAQDCASAPLLGARAAAGLELARSLENESAASASFTAALGYRFRLSGGYRATRLDEVDRLQRAVRVEGSLPIAFRSMVVCPVAGMSYGRLSTERSGRQGQVTTRVSWLGAELGRAVALNHALALTPFVQPLLARRDVGWRSAEAGWVIDDSDTNLEGQLWMGVTLATSRNAIIARFRPSTSGQSGEFSLGAITTFGKR